MCSFKYLCKLQMKPWNRICERFRGCDVLLDSWELSLHQEFIVWYQFRLTLHITIRVMTKRIIAFIIHLADVAASDWILSSRTPVYPKIQVCVYSHQPIQYAQLESKVLLACSPLLAQIWAIHACLRFSVTTFHQHLQIFACVYPAHNSLSINCLLKW